jgi:hypothetical protein
MRSMPHRVCHMPHTMILSITSPTNYGTLDPAPSRSISLHTQTQTQTQPTHEDLEKGHTTTLVCGQRVDESTITVDNKLVVRINQCRDHEV